jgi:hypothetical protein
VTADVGNERAVEKRWPKACRCGETWTRAEWSELTPVGKYLADEWLELRSCVCGKTLAVPASELGYGANGAAEPIPAR